MTSRSPSTLSPRLVAIAALALIILLALFFATGGFSSSSTPSAPSAPQPDGATATPASGQVQGAVTVAVRRLSGHTWRFVYAIRNEGKVPIAGFQLNGASANLFHLTGRFGWTAFGSGVCGGKYPGVLVYWSTGASAGNVIPPHGTEHFGFDVNTSAAGPRMYSMAWGSSAPLFGNTRGPAPSSLPASGSCKG